MKAINFEGLGLKFNINSIAFELFSISVYWYAICIVLGFGIGFLLAKKDDGKYNIKYEHVLEMMIFIIPVSIICARLYYIIFKFSDYINNPGEIFNIRNGGLAIYGGIIGSFVVIIFFCKLKNIKLLDMMDYVVPFLPLGQAIGRWGNFFNRRSLWEGD